MNLFHKKYYKTKVLNYKDGEKGLAISTVLIIVGAAAAIGLAIAPTITAKIGSNFLLSIMYGLGLVLFYVFSGFCKVSAGLFDAGLLHLSMPITTDQMFVSAWTQVRNLANMLIVLGFVVVGISFALRLGEYGSRKTLFKLVAVALLINFSGLLCGLVIDAANITSSSFLQQGAGTGSGMGMKLNSAIDNLSKKVFQSSEYTDSTDGTATLTILWPVTLLYLFIGVTLFYLACIFIARYAVLALLFILSPIAFACWIFPVSKKIWSDWLNHFIKWTFIGVGGSFLMWVGFGLLTAISDKAGIVGISPYDLIVVALFFYVGLKLITQSSAQGASAIIGLAGSALGFAAGAVMGATGTGSMAGKLLGKSGATGAEGGKAVGGVAQKGYSAATNKVGTLMANSGVSGVKQAGQALQWASKPNALQKTRSALGRGLEAIGAIDVGAEATAGAKSISAKTAGYASALSSGNKSDETRVMNAIKNGTGQDQAGAVLAAVNAGKIHAAFKDPSTGNIDYKGMNKAITDAQASGAPDMRKTAEGKYYQLAGFSNKNVDAALTSLGHKVTIDAALGAKANTATPAERMAAARSVLSGPDIARAEEKANYTKLSQNWGSMDLESKANTDLGGLNPVDLKEFALSRNAEDIKAFKLLDAGHDNRTIHKTTMLGHVNAELATPGISTNRQRRLQEVRDELMKL